MNSCVCKIFKDSQDKRPALLPLVFKTFYSKHRVSPANQSKSHRHGGGRTKSPSARSARLPWKHRHLQIKPSVARERLISFPPLSLLLRKTIFTTSDLQNVAKYVPRGASLTAQTVKNLPAMQETQVRSLDGKDSLEIGMTTHSSILAWKIPCTEEPGGPQSMRWQRLREY